jgi:hypothetical protein
MPKETYQYRGVVPQTDDPNGPMVQTGITTDPGAVSLETLRELYPGAPVRRERRTITYGAWETDLE